MTTGLKVKRNVGTPRNKRQYIYEALQKLNVGDGIEVPAEKYMNTRMAAAYAAKTKPEFKGWVFQCFRSSEATYVVKRIA